MTKKPIDVLGYTREIELIWHDCKAGADCPYCGGRFEGAKQAKYCSRAASQWAYRRRQKARNQ